MTVTKTTSIAIKTDDLKGSGAAEFNAATLQRIGPIKTNWASTSLSFASVAEYQLFVDQIIIPLTNILNSTSGSGTNYDAIVPGTAGNDKVVD